jgi:hypothetical protein
MPANARLNNNLLQLAQGGDRCLLATPLLSAASATGSSLGKFDRHETALSNRFASFAGGARDGALQLGLGHGITS